MTPELTIAGLLMTGITGLAGYVVKQQANAMASKDAEITRLHAQYGADIAWLRGQLESWTQIGRSAVATAEKISDKAGP